MNSEEVTIVVPTYGRGQVLVDTLRMLLELAPRAIELLVVDQTPRKHGSVSEQLARWDEQGAIRWIKVDQPSIPAAMNHGLTLAGKPLVLFLDDDVRPTPELIARHARAHREHPEFWVTVGQVIQPWQNSAALAPPPKSQSGLEQGLGFPFNSTLEADVKNVMAGNLCVKRNQALSIGGFDENFVGPAYRFETDFARRVLKAGGRIRFIGAAGVHHLRAESGGTRAYGNHLTSASPLHGVGDYYYAFRHGGGQEAWLYSMRRLFREVRTRFHLTHPWWIPVKLVGEVRALRLARRKLREGPRLIPTPDST